MKKKVLSFHVWRIFFLLYAVFIFVQVQTFCINLVPNCSFFMYFMYTLCFRSQTRRLLMFEILRWYVVNRNRMRSLKSNEHINEKRDWQYRGFGYSSLFGDPIDLATWNQRELLHFNTFQHGIQYKDKSSINQNESNTLNVRKCILIDNNFSISQITLADLEGSIGKYTLHYGWYTGGLLGPTRHNISCSNSK